MQEDKQPDDAEGRPEIELGQLPDETPTERKARVNAQLDELVATFDPEEEEKLELPLVNPVSTGTKGEPVSKLTFAQPNFGTVKALPTTGLKMEDMLKLVGKMTGQPDYVLHRLRARDSGRALTVANRYLEPFLPTGE